MVQPYNLSTLNAQDGLYGFLNAANTLSGGLFGTLILIVVYIIMVVSWRREDTKQSFAAASFVVALLSIFLRLLQWIPDITMFSTFIIAGLTFVMLKWGT